LRVELPFATPGDRQARPAEGGVSVFSRHLIESAAWTPGGLRLAVRLNWYRALPLSCLERLEIELDGERLDSGRVTLEVGERSFALGELAEQDDAWWHVAEACRVSIALEPAARAGTSTVELVMGTRIPYLVDPGGDAVVIVDRASSAVAA
jgi:hypothetical protein